MTEPRVNFGIQLRISDEVHDPPLCLLRCHVQFFGEHCDANALVNAAECLKDHHARVLDEILETRDKEEVIHEVLAQTVTKLFGVIGNFVNDSELKVSIKSNWCATLKQLSNY